MTVGPSAFMALSALLFAIGLFGALSKKSAVMVLMSLEIMAIAVNLNLIAFWRFSAPARMAGQVFALFVMVVSAAEIGIGLALVLAAYKRTRSVELPSMERLKG